MEDRDITKEVSIIRREFRVQTGIVCNNSVDFLNHLPAYCDWLEEKLIAAQSGTQAATDSQQLKPETVKPCIYAAKCAETGCDGINGTLICYTVA